MSRLPLVLVLAAPLVACGGKLDVSFDDAGATGETSPSTDTGGSVDTGIDAGGCTPADCGPAPGIPSERCWDGSYAGAVCTRTAAGTCGWTFTKCPAPKSCTTSAGCGAANLFCQTPDGLCSDKGVCALKPDGCGKNYDPVCGCDRITYGNPCLAMKAGVNVLIRGSCEMPPPPDTSCGGFGGGVCSSSDYCSYFGGGCGFSDGTGVCQPRPMGCTDIYAPVCGCDGHTYGNECDAHMNGQDVQYVGKCK